MSQIFGLDAPIYLCITGPNYKMDNVGPRNHQKENPHKGGRVPTPCIVVDPMGHRHKARSYSAAARMVGQETRGVTNIRRAIAARGIYNTRNGYSILAIK